MFYNSDDCGNCGTRTILEFTSSRGFIPGRDYIIGVRGWSSSAGTYGVDINCRFPPSTGSPTKATPSPSLSPTIEPTIKDCSVCSPFGSCDETPFAFFINGLYWAHVRCVFNIFMYIYTQYYGQYILI